MQDILRQLIKWEIITLLRGNISDIVCEKCANSSCLDASRDTEIIMKYNDLSIWNGFIFLTVSIFWLGTFCRGKPFL